MCNKLIVLCVALVVVGLSVPASAASQISLNNPLKVDIDGEGTVTPQGDWWSWLFTNTIWYKSWPSPQNATFDMGVAGTPPQAELSTRQSNGGTAGVSRNRSGGWAGVAGELLMQQPGVGFGMDYVKLTLTSLDPSTEYKFFLWSYESRNIWSCDPCNLNSKYGVWSTTNPVDWLVNNGYDGSKEGEPPQGGYGPKVGEAFPAPQTDSNMPAGLADLVAAQGGRASLIAEDGNDHLGEWQNYVSFYASTNDLGQIVLYGWIDPTDWTGSMHMPLNGFMVVPEPATLALLTLGGLPLLRKRRK